MLKNSSYIYNLLREDNVNTSLNYCKKAQVGVDLTVKSIYKFGSKGKVSLKGTDLPEYIELDCKDNIFDLKKGSYIVILNEGIELNGNDTGIIIGRSSLNRNGVSISSAVWDPGYTSNLQPMSIRLTVDNEHGFELEKNARVAQLLIFENEDCDLYKGQFQGGKGTPCKNGMEV